MEWSTLGDILDIYFFVVQLYKWFNSGLTLTLPVEYGKLPLKADAHKSVRN